MNKLIFFLFLLVSQPLLACQSIEVKILASTPYTLSLSTGSGSLYTESYLFVGNPTSSSNKILGVTYATQILRPVKSIDLKGCKHYSIELAFIDIKIQIAKELEDNPCLFSHVKNHEEEHVKRYQQYLEDNLNTYKSMFNNEMSDDEMQLNMVKLFDIIKKGILEYQLEIDTQLEAAQINYICQGAAKDIVR